MTVAERLASGPTATEGMATVVSLLRVQRILQLRIDRVLAPFDLTFARFEILSLLAFSADGSVRITRLAERLQVHPTSVSSAVRRLEVSDHACRKQSVDDKRVVFAQITSHGRREVSAATASLNRDVFEHLGISAAEVDSLLLVLRSFRANAGDF